MKQKISIILLCVEGISGRSGRIVSCVLVISLLLWYSVPFRADHSQFKDIAELEKIC